MRKIFYFSIVVLLSVFVLNAQSRSIKSFIKVKPQIKAKQLITNDSIDYVDGNGAIYTTTDGGFATGVNEYGDLGKYQKFSLTDNYLVKGYYFYTYVDKIVGTPDNVYLVIKSVAENGEPGTTLSTVTKSTAELSADGWNIFDLAVPVQAGKEFFIGMEWDESIDDTLAIVSDEDGLGYGQGASRSWEKWSDGTYMDMNTSWGGFDVDLWIGMIGEKLTDTPVELSSLSANVNNGAVILNWSTVSEKNNKGFEIQRSSDKINFTKVGYVSGNGTTLERKSYSFKDNSIDAGKNYYRLKQMDYDGAFKYSPLVEVDFAAVNSFTLNQNYPNPFNPSTFIKYSLPSNSNVKITISNALGQLVKELANELQQSGVHVINFNASGLTSGIYFYTVNASSLEGNSNFTATKKMILVK